MLQSFYKKSEKFAIIAQTLRMLQRLSEKKANIAEPTDMVELSNVANITVPSKYCKVFESLQILQSVAEFLYRKKK